VALLSPACMTFFDLSNIEQATAFVYEFLGEGDMFEDDFGDTCGGKFPLVSMRGRAEGLACAETGARTPIGVRRNFLLSFFLSSSSFSHRPFPEGVVDNEKCLKCPEIAR
jgi:hypothetical protein